MFDVVEKRLLFVHVDQFNGDRIRVGITGGHKRKRRRDREFVATDDRYIHPVIVTQGVAKYKLRFQTPLELLVGIV